MTENERLATIEVQVAQNIKDIEDLKDDNKIIRDIATSVKVMATEMQGMSQQMAEVKSDISDVKEKVNADIANVKERVSEVENKPAKEIAENAKKIKIAVITAIASMLATGVVSSIIVFAVK